MGHRVIVVVVVVVVALAFAGCGRLGYGPADAAISDDATAPIDTSVPDAFVPDTAVSVDGSIGMVSVVAAAVLDREQSVVALPDRLPAAVTSPAASAVGNTVYLAGGSRNALSLSNCTTDVAVYGADGSMSTMPGELPVANQGFGLVEAAGALHSVMGLCGGSDTDERTVYRHTMDGAAPEMVGLFDQGAYYLSTGVVPDALGDETIIIAGGFGSGPLRNFIQTMSPLDGTSAMLPTTLPSHRCLASSVSLGGAFYVIGGSTHTSCVPSAASPTLAMTDEIVRITIDPEVAEVVATLPTPVAASCAVELGDGTVALFGGLHYVDDGAGGFNREATDEIILFDPRTNAVTTSAVRLPVARSQMSCARTADDRTLLFGGADADGTVTDEVLLFAPYAAASTASGVLDAATAGADWDSLTIDEVVPPGTTITYSVRTAEDLAAPGAWVEVSAGTLPAEVLPGRYLEWRAELTSDSPVTTPELERLVATFSL